MAFTTIELDTTSTIQEVESYLIFDDKYTGVRSISDFLRAMGGGLRQGVLNVRVGSLKASGTFTITSTGPALGETLSIAGVTFTAVASNPGDGEFIRSDTPATAAANIAASINASTLLAGIVVATSALGVVTVTSVNPGIFGNQIVLGEAAANTAAVGLSGGSDGTKHVLNFL